MPPRSSIARALAVLAQASGLWALTAADRITPLAPASHGATGFARVPSLESGIRFQNTLPASAAARNQNLANGSGIAVGDVDGDGLPDLYFAAIHGTNRLYRNLGGWHFEDITDKAGVGCAQWTSTGVVLEDVDGDGDLDLLVSTLGTGVHLFLNDGTGRFTENTVKAGLASKTGSMSMALGDVDGNGTLDLYVANYGAQPILKSGPGRATIKQVNGQWVVEGPFADRLRVVDNQIEEVGEVGVLYLGDGKGGFTPAPWNSDRFLDEQGKPKAPPADYGLSAQIRDINGDGFPDLYTCNDFQSPDRVWINDGKGHFREVSRLAVRKFAFSSMGVDFADLDRDGNLDFITVEMSPRSHARRMRSLTGARFLPNIPGRYDYRPEVTRNTLYRGNGDGTWSELAEHAGVASTEWSWQPVFLDVDLDGYEDLLVASGVMFDVQDRDTTERILTGARSGGTLGGTNLLRFPAFPSAISAFRNRHDFTFEDVHASWGFTNQAYFQGIALADLDGDGDLDLICNCVNGEPALYRNEASAPRIAVRARGMAPNTRGINARIRVTGGPVVQTQELISGGRYLSGDDVIRTFATGAASEVQIDVTWRSGRRSRIAHALPGRLYEVDESGAEPAIPDEPPKKVRPLLADVSKALNFAHHEELFDDFVHQPLLHRQLSSLGPQVGWVDLDGDGRPELIVGTGRGGKLGGFRFREDETVNVLASEWVAPDDVLGMTAWMLPDGRPALLAAVANYETAPERLSSVVAITLTAGGALQVNPVPEIPETTASLGTLASADLDGDGRLDLFVGTRVSPAAYPTAPGSRLFRTQANGSLKADTEAGKLFAEVGMVSGAVWTDLNGDGFPELVLSCEWGPVRVFRNAAGHLSTWDPLVQMTEAGRTREVPLSQITGWWGGVGAGDFDGDGRMDLVVGNWGSNTGYRASPEQPLRLLYGNLGGSGATDLIEAYYPTDLTTEMPRRSRRALTQAIPSLADRFPTHAAFGDATLAGIVAALPVAPQIVTARTLASLVLLNRGDHFEAVELPARAQWSPVQGISVADVDGDGNADLLLAQNFFAMRVEWPRTDAGQGLVLLGDGHGGFRPLPAREAGVMVHGEQRGCAVADFDGDGRPDWVNTQNGAATRLFRNYSGKSGIRVTLQGPKRNPTAIGAVVQLRTASGWGAAQEIHGSSGQGSVDAPEVLLFGSGDAVRVRWPGGRVTETPVNPGTRALQIRQAP